VRLLRAIDDTGSIRAAAGRIGWSYRHALAYIDNAEEALGERLVERTRGGNDRGGASLTQVGRTFVTRYNRFREALDDALHRLYDSAFAARA
jgi:molybdate transport system regulatory protein